MKTQTHELEGYFKLKWIYDLIFVSDWPLDIRLDACALVDEVMLENYSIDRDWESDTYCVYVNPIKKTA